MQADSLQHKTDLVFSILKLWKMHRSFIAQWLSALTSATRGPSWSPALGEKFSRSEHAVLAPLAGLELIYFPLDGQVAWRAPVQEETILWRLKIPLLKHVYNCFLVVRPAKLASCWLQLMVEYE